MGKRLVVAFTGYPGAGKTTAAKHAAAVYGVPYYSLGEPMRAEARARGIELTDRSVNRRILEEISKRDGPDVLIKPVLSSEGDMVIDGLRRVYDLRRLASIPNTLFRVIAIHAPLERRHELAMLGREERGNRDSTDLEVFRQAETAEAQSNDPFGLSIEDVMRQADHILYNDFPTKDSYLEAIKVLIADIRGENT